MKFKIAIPLLILSFQAVLATNGTIAEGADKRSWTLDNGLVSRRIIYSDGGGLSTESLMCSRTKLDLVGWTERPGEVNRDRGDEFSVNVGERTLRGFDVKGPADFSFAGAETSDTASAPGRELIVSLKAKAGSIEVKVHYAIYAGFPAVRKWLVIKNDGPDTATLSHLVVEALDGRVGPAGIQKVSAHYGAEPREIFMTGRADDCLVTEENAISGEGIALLNEAPGWMKNTDLTQWGLGFAIGYCTDLFPFERRLLPGESFTTAAADVAFYLGDSSPDEKRTQCHAQQRLSPPLSGFGPN